MSPAEARARWKGVRLFDALNRRERRWMVSTKLGTKKWRVVFGDDLRAVALQWAAEHAWTGEIIVYIAHVKDARHPNGQPRRVHAVTMTK